EQGCFPDRSGNNTRPNGGGVNPYFFKLAFKSKVVSCAPAELWINTSLSGTSSAPGYAAPKFFIRNESSFGTFLNSIRLGPAGQDSCPY
ncbi:hypothetical protein BDP27DRAFT_1234624, partial [Rhodocollybia butyracea]